MTSPFDSLTKHNRIFQTSDHDLFYKRLTHLSLKTILPFVKTHTPQKKGAMVLYPANDFGSLGDQAMFLSAIEGLKKQGYHEFSLLSPIRPSKNDIPEFSSNLLNPDFYFKDSITQSIHFQKTFASNDGLFIIGADVMDGHYSTINSLRKIHLLQLAADLGLPTKVFGFSFNEHPADEVVTALKYLPPEVQLLARDPVSQRRLESKLNRSIRLVADLAFLLQANPSGESASTTLNWIKKQKDDGARVIGINANALLARNNFKDPFPIATGLAHTMVELNKTNPDLRFVMIAHDFRGTYDDALLNRVSAEIASFTNSSLKKNIFIMPTPCTAAEVKAVCRDLDLAITGRMHLAIACLGQGTPALCIGYQGKMEGLFEHFELQNMVISPKDAFNSNQLVKSANILLTKTPELRTQISEYLPKVLSLAKLNFE